MCKRSFPFILLIALSIACYPILQVSAQTPPLYDGDGYQLLWDMKEGRLPASDGMDATDDDTGYDALHYDIEIKFDWDAQSVDGRVDMLFTVTETQITELDMRLRNNMVIDLLEVDGQAATYNIVSNSDLIIDLPQPLYMNDSATVSIEYHGNPIAGSLGALSWSDHSGTPTIESLSEPNGARTWWPCKDYPWEKTTARMVWTVPDWMTATSNGLLESVTTPEPGWTSYEWIENYPVTTYLICITATDFSYWQDWYVTVSGDSLPIDNYVYPEHLSNSYIDFAIVPEQIAFFASIYGEYPFMEEKYGHAEFHFWGAMEHQTITSMGQYFIDGSDEHQWIYAHELSHMWWGDLVTCATWDDIWLNEGFATYSDALWAGETGGTAGLNSRLATFRNTYFQSEYNDGRFPIYDPEEMWGGTVYEKGAWIMHMIRYVLGEDNFWDFFLEWRDRYSYGAANTAQMLETLEDVIAADFDWFFDEWVYMAGFPEYHWGWQYEPLGEDSSRVDISIIQTQPDTADTPLVFTMPIEFGVTTTSGYETHSVWNDQRNQNFSFDVSGTPTNVAFDPNLWILDTVANTGYVAVSEEPAELGEYELSLSVMPNPANPFAVASFKLQDASHVRLNVYDISGRMLESLVSETLLPGTHRFRWDAIGAASGVYLFRLTTEHGVQTARAVILK